MLDFFKGRVRDILGIAHVGGVAIFNKDFILNNEKRVKGGMVDRGKI